MMGDDGRAPSGQALAVSVEPVSRLDPSGFDPSRWYDIIGRCERAHGRDPWLNRDIEVMIGRGRDCDDPVRQKDAYAMPLHRSDYYVPPEYTRSFDAALTLLPWDMHVNLYPFIDASMFLDKPKRRWAVELVRLEDEDPPQGWRGVGDNPALALCVAALRSRKRAIAMEARQDGNNEDWSHPKDDSAGRNGIAQTPSASPKGS